MLFDGGADRGQVRAARSTKAGSSGAAALWASAGRKPPSRSDESVCWLRFSTTSGAPTCDREP